MNRQYFDQVEKNTAGLVVWHSTGKKELFFSLESTEVLPYFAKPNDNGLNKMKNISYNSLF